MIELTWGIWVTGLPGSGKSSIARQLRTRLRIMGIDVMSLELDKIRKVVTPEPTYTEEERVIVYRALAYMAHKLTQVNMNVIIDATANKQEFRDLARELIPRFLEVYVKCPLDEAMKREKRRIVRYSPKGIYNKGKTGESKTVPGLNVDYEIPPNPEVVIESDKVSVSEGVHSILSAIELMY